MWSGRDGDVRGGFGQFLELSAGHHVKGRGLKAQRLRLSDHMGLASFGFESGFDVVDGEGVDTVKVASSTKSRTRRAHDDSCAVGSTRWSR